MTICRRYAPFHAQIGQVTQQGTAMVEQSSAAARTLADGTAQLRSQIAFFQVRTAESRPARIGSFPPSFARVAVTVSFEETNWSDSRIRFRAENISSLSCKPHRKTACLISTSPNLTGPECFSSYEHTGPAINKFAQETPMAQR
jgi:hypothetical protein